MRGMGDEDLMDDDKVQHKRTVTEKLRDGTHKLKEIKERIVKKKDVKKEDIRILTDEEINNLPMANILVSSVEILSYNELLLFGIITKGLLKLIRKKNCRYICSIRTISIAESIFEDILLYNVPSDCIERIGHLGYKNYFIRCSEYKQKYLTLYLLMRLIEHHKRH